MNFSEMMKNQYIIIGLIVVAASMFALTVRGGDTAPPFRSIVEADVPAEKETTEEITGEEK